MIICEDVGSIGLVGGRAPKCVFKVRVVLMISIVLYSSDVFSAHKKAVSKQNSASVTAYTGEKGIRKHKEAVGLVIWHPRPCMRRFWE